MNAIFNNSSIPLTATNSTNNISQTLNSFNNVETSYSKSSLNAKAVIEVTVHFVIFILGTIGNVLLISVIIRYRSMHCATNWFVFNLAMSDLGMTIINLPLTNIYKFTSWPFGEPVCRYFLGSFGECIVGVSVFTHTALGLVRYRVVLKPMQPRIRLRHVCCGIIFIWLLAYACLSAPITGKFRLVHSEKVGGYVCKPIWPSFEYKLAYRGSVFAATYVIPMVIATFCYIKIFTALKRSIKFLIHDSAATNAQIKRREHKSKRLTKALYVLYTIFACTTLPLEIFYLLTDSQVVPITASMAHVWSMLVALFYSLSVINPMILFYMSEDYRNQLYAILFRRKCCFNNGIIAVSRRLTKSSRIESNTQNVNVPQIPWKDSRKSSQRFLKPEYSVHQMDIIRENELIVSDPLVEEEKKETLV